MYQIIDWIFLAALVGIVIYATARGFVRAVYRLVSLIVAIVIASTFAAPLGNILYDSFLYSAVEGGVESALTSVASGTVGAVDAEAVLDGLPEEIGAAASFFGVDLADTIKNVTETNETQIPKLAASIAQPIATSAAKLLATVLLFVCAMLVLRLFRFVLDWLMKLPILHGLNRIFGFVFGVLEASVIGILLAKLLVAVCSVYAIGHAEFPLSDLMGNTQYISFFAGLC